MNAEARDPYIACFLFVKIATLMMNLILAEKFNSTMRYIDDLLTLNNTGFESAIDNIYPPEIQLKMTTECPTKLDILIIIDNVKYSMTMGNTQLSLLSYDKFSI